MRRRKAASLIACGSCAMKLPRARKRCLFSPNTAKSPIPLAACKLCRESSGKRVFVLHGWHPRWQACEGIGGMLFLNATVARPFSCSRSKPVAPVSISPPPPM